MSCCTKSTWLLRKVSDCREKHHVQTLLHCGLHPKPPTGAEMRGESVAHSWAPLSSSSLVLPMTTKGLSSGAAQWSACWAHNPKVPGSKPGSAIHVLLREVNMAATKDQRLQRKKSQVQPLLHCGLHPTLPPAQRCVVNLWPALGSHSRAAAFSCP